MKAQMARQKIMVMVFILFCKGGRGAPWTYGIEEWDNDFYVPGGAL
jgi:hypothetical protein